MSPSPCRNKICTQHITALYKYNYRETSENSCYVLFPSPPDLDMLVCVCSYLLSFMWPTWSGTATILIIVTMCVWCCSSWKPCEFLNDHLFSSWGVGGGGVYSLQHMRNPNRLPLTSWPAIDFSQTPVANLKAALFTPHHQRWTREEMIEIMASTIYLSLPQIWVEHCETLDLVSWYKLSLSFSSLKLVGFRCNTVFS